MAIKLTTTLNKISFVPNSTNSTIIKDFYEYMRANGSIILSDGRFSYSMARGLPRARRYADDRAD
jgi:hypothetical protein